MEIDTGRTVCAFGLALLCRLLHLRQEGAQGIGSFERGFPLGGSGVLGACGNFAFQGPLKTLAPGRNLDFRSGGDLCAGSGQGL